LYLDLSKDTEITKAITLMDNGKPVHDILGAKPTAKKKAAPKKKTPAKKIETKKPATKKKTPVKKSTSKTKGAK